MMVPANERLAALTNREEELLGLIALGWSNGMIGERLWLSPKTVETHVRSIFSKLDLPPSPQQHRRVAAVLVYLEAREPAARRTSHAA